jgi:hypothetical protein
VAKVPGVTLRDRITAGQRIAAFPIKTLQEAACLLSCVYMDDDTEAAWGDWQRRNNSPSWSA